MSMTIERAKSELMQIYGALSPDKQRAIDTLVNNSQEPKVGHWAHDGSYWKYRFICSECNYRLLDKPTNYCPNCGCAMKGELE